MTKKSTHASEYATTHHYMYILYRFILVENQFLRGKKTSVPILVPASPAIIFDVRWLQFILYIYRYILVYAARVVRNNPVFRTINIHPKSWMQTHKKDPKNIRPVSSFFFLLGFRFLKKYFLSFVSFGGFLRQFVRFFSPSQTVRVSDVGKPTKILPLHENIRKKNSLLFWRYTCIYTRVLQWTEILTIIIIRFFSSCFNHVWTRHFQTLSLNNITCNFFFFLTFSPTNYY